MIFIIKWCLMCWCCRKTCAYHKYELDFIVFPRHSAQPRFNLHKVYPTALSSLCQKCSSDALADIPIKDPATETNIYPHTKLEARVVVTLTLSRLLTRYKDTRKKATVEKFICKVLLFTSGKLLPAWALTNTKQEILNQCVFGVEATFTFSSSWWYLVL